MRSGSSRRCSRWSARCSTPACPKCAGPCSALRLCRARPFRARASYVAPTREATMPLDGWPDTTGALPDESLPEGAAVDVATPGPDVDAIFDVIVVGSGAAGAVAAFRLAASGCSVAIVEEGPWIFSRDMKRISSTASERSFATRACRRSRAARSCRSCRADA
ncbi:MAG: FAD-binding protein [Myxococcales bacterium]|nr:FAD-binding protein [Myxococcales bacterium]